MGLFLSIDLDRDKVLVDELCSFQVFKALACHYVTPMTGGITDGKQHRLVLLGCVSECSLAPTKVANSQDYARAAANKAIAG